MKMKRLPRLLAAFLTIFTIAIPMTAAPASPNFAVPKKVEKASARQMESDLSQSRYTQAIGELVKWSLAKTMVSSDSIPAVLSKIAEVRSAVKSAPDRALLDLFEARLYTEIYSNRSRTYDQRSNPSAEQADDYRLWDEQTFANKVSMLCSQAMADAQALRDAPLSQFKDIVTFSHEDLSLYPTLLDFVANQTIDDLKTFENRNRILSAQLIDNPLDSKLYPQGLTGQILSAYNMLVAGREETLPGVNALKNMIVFMSPRLFTRILQSELSPWRSDNSALYAPLMSAYKAHSQSPYAVEFLLASQPSTPEQRTEVYNLLTAFAKANPTYFNINAVKNQINELGERSVNVTYPDQAAPEIPVSVQVAVNNVNTLTIKVYDVTSSVNYPSDQSCPVPAGAQPIASVTVDAQGIVPFATTRTATLTFPKYGLYIIVPEFDGMTRDASKHYSVVAVSRLTGGFIAGSKKSWGIVADAVTGQPVADASMLFRTWERRREPRFINGKTDAEGFLALEVEKNGTLQPRKGEDKYATAFQYYNYSESNDKERVSAAVTTSLGLYRPGDKLDFAAVVYTNFKDRHAPAADRKFTAYLRNANYVRIDTLELTTDTWGRAEGSFTLPDDGLTGEFGIEIYGPSEDYWGQGSFMVSDYKLPTFIVACDNVERPANTASPAVISGSATTFAGFPVANAAVKLQLKVRSGFWFWATTSPVFYEAKAETDAQGKFRIEVPASVIASSPNANGYFIADVAVTSEAGETHVATSGFNMGKPLTITASVPALYIPTQTKAAVALSDYSGKELAGELNYKVYKTVRELSGGNGEERFDSSEDTDRTDSVVASGKTATGLLTAILDALPSGEYYIELSTEDKALADSYKTRNFVVYKKTDTSCPVNAMLWMPENRLIADAEGNATLTYGTALKDAYVMATVCDEDSKILMHRWLKGVTGMNTLELKLPEGSPKMRVYLQTVQNFKSASLSADIEAATSQEKIEITTETFRDKVIPGQKETLTFRIKVIAGASARSAMILDMSNKAIDVLRENPMNLSVSDYFIRGLYINGWQFNSSYVNSSCRIDPLSVFSSSMPAFNLYGQSFFPIRIRGYAMMMSAASGGVTARKAMAADMGVKEEAADECEAAAPTEIGNANVALEEPKVQGDEAQEKETYRPSEIPLAFFRPMLVTDADGSLAVSYEVSDANTTWVLRALAYNEKMLTSALSREIVASKPVMVSTNAPRFLRIGDRVRLQASVMNATDSVLTLSTLCEVVGSQDLKPLASNSEMITLQPKTSQEVYVEYEAPTTLNSVIFRVKASAGKFTDGEQALIAVLPGTQDVVESQMFYIAPDSASFRMDIPAVDSGRAYLRFTENPTWEVVSALPGLRKNDINSSIEASSALFSACVAEGLMSQYPEIARALRRWSENPADSVLVSALEKNNELKQILLSDSPWVQEGMSQTERMQRLVLLLDSRYTATVKKEAIAQLSRCYDSGGGWFWTTQYPRVSRWATEHILSLLGDLNRMGWLPSDSRLKNMLSGSVKYYDAETVRTFNKYPKSDFTTYCYVRRNFPEIKQSTAAAKVTRLTVQRAISNWKSASLVGRAVDALILNANGYNATARQILESLQENATVTPERGMWWQQLENTWFYSLDKVGCTAIILDAFAEVNPSSLSIDLIRQWLLLEKVNTDWGSAPITSQVITSILCSGSRWTVNPSGTAIRINNQLLTPAAEAFTGSFTEQITPMVKTPSVLTIDRQANYPSLGAVVTLRTLPADRIEAVGCKELSVSKSMRIFREGKWIDSESFAVGDRVQVSLVVNADTDIDYLVINDLRAAGLEPVEQLPTPIVCEGLYFYRENRDSQTNIFIDSVPRGVYVLAYELFASQAGTFTSGAAQAQSLYNPAVAAHSSGAEVVIK